MYTYAHYIHIIYTSHATSAMPPYAPHALNYICHIGSDTYEINLERPRPHRHPASQSGAAPAKNRGPMRTAEPNRVQLSPARPSQTQPEIDQAQPDDHRDSPRLTKSHRATWRFGHATTTETHRDQSSHIEIWARCHQQFTESH